MKKGNAIQFFVKIREGFVSVKAGPQNGAAMARQWRGLARGLAHWRKDGACRMAVQPPLPKLAFVFRAGGANCTIYTFYMV